MYTNVHEIENEKFKKLVVNGVNLENSFKFLCGTNLTFFCLCVLVSND